jgi:predicted nucleic acid-binding Zn ribbon protein
VERAASVLSPLLKRLGVDEAVRLQQIRNDWQALFGKPLLSHMSPSRLFGGDLLLSVDSPAWMQQLGFCKKEILQKLSGYGVRDLKFRIGRVSTKNRQKVSDVSDDLLRETIRKTIEKSLLSAKRQT